MNLRCRLRPLATPRFIQRAWPVVEPSTRYVHGWHIDAIAAHLEAVTSGEINRLLINVPPGTMKSLAVGVLWPAWEWGPRRSRSSAMSAPPMPKTSRSATTCGCAGW